MFDPDRGTGRTWQLVNDARAGDVIVVVHAGGRDEVKRYLARQGRPLDELRIVMLADDRAADRLRGVPRDRRVYVDHAAAEIARVDACASRTMTEIDVHATARLGGLHYYPVSDPCDTGRAGAPHSAKRASPGMSGA